MAAAGALVGVLPVQCEDRNSLSFGYVVEAARVAAGRLFHALVIDRFDNRLNSA